MDALVEDDLVFGAPPAVRRSEFQLAHLMRQWIYANNLIPHIYILHVSLFPIATKQTTRWFLDELHRRYQLDDVVFPMDDADYLGAVLAEDGYRFQIGPHGNRNATERVFLR